MLNYATTREEARSIFIGVGLYHAAEIIADRNEGNWDDETTYYVSNMLQYVGSIVKRFEFDDLGDAYYAYARNFGYIEDFEGLQEAERSFYTYEHSLCYNILLDFGCYLMRQVFDQFPDLMEEKEDLPIIMEDYREGNISIIEDPYANMIDAVAKQFLADALCEAANITIVTNKYELEHFTVVAKVFKFLGETINTLKLENFETLEDFSAYVVEAISEIVEQVQLAA